MHAFAKKSRLLCKGVLKSWNEANNFNLDVEGKIMLSIISWNVNGVRAAAKKNLLGWLADESPDIFCKQETKAMPEQVDDNVLKPNGYHSYWQSAKRKGYSGVATYSKAEPLAVETLGVEEFDDEGRMQALEFEKFILVNCYYPNSQGERARLPYKQGFNKAILEYCNARVESGKNIILCGDYNVAHKPIDLTHPKPNENNAGYYIEEREDMTRFIESGYVDTFRHFCKEPNQYTWWSYRMNAREKNVGWRIDYFCVNEEFISKVHAASIMSEVYGSDHCPVKLVVDL